MKIIAEHVERERKIVKRSGKTGRIYLPRDWIGLEVMIIRSQKGKPWKITEESDYEEKISAEIGDEEDS